MSLDTINASCKATSECADFRVADFLSADGLVCDVTNKTGAYYKQCTTAFLEEASQSQS